MSAAKIYSEFSLILFIIDLQKLNFLSRGNVCVRAQLLSHMQLFAISWTWATRLFLPWNFPGKNTGMGCHFLLQEILPTQGSNPRLLCLLHCRWILYLVSHRGSPVCLLICKLTSWSATVLWMLKNDTGPLSQRQKNLSQSMVNSMNISLLLRVPSAPKSYREDT